MIVDPRTVESDLALAADACVIGSGAGGSVVAKELAEAGHSVIVLEEGGYAVNRDFTQRETEMYQRLYREQASRATSDFTVLVAQGRTVGGSTVGSYCLCARAPRQILDLWQNEHGVRGIDAEAMFTHFQRIETLLGVHPMADADLNRNNAKFRTGAERLGLRGTIPMHNRIDCLGCGYCALGCSYDRKTDALTAILPAASRAGALLLPGCRVEQIAVSDGKVSGVHGVIDSGRGPRAVRVRARVVVLAAGAIGSAELWLRSRLPNTYFQVGRNLRLHPLVVVAAVFDEEIEGWRGIPQAYVVDEFVRLDAAGGGYSLTPTFVHPVAAAALLPGLGEDHRGLMESYGRMAMAAVTLHDRTAGSVVLDTAGRGVVAYHLDDDDRTDLMDGMRRAADVYFAAGAQRVVLPYTDLVELTKRGDYRAIDERGIRLNDPLLFSYQPHGTLRMGADPKRSVVSGLGEAHEVPGLFVADASIFPTSIAVPPQLSVMAFAARTARFIDARLR